MDYKKILNDYRPIPFWSWNERLECEQTRRQVRLMHEAGIGGYFMHARGGLLTEYMGEEWFANVDAACEEGAGLGMRSWAYDENGWPSGFANGIVLAMGEDYHLKSLTYKRSEDYDGEPHRVLLEKDGYTYYYQPNELYVDLLNPKVTEAFIENVHEVYRKRCADRIEGFFTDEPQLLRVPGFPYSVVTLDEFKRRYGYDLVPMIPALFFDSPDSARVRFDFWKMTTDLFSKNFFKKIYDWCEEHGYKLTGHLVCEEVMEDVIPTSGADMPHYEYFHIPGMDWLGRPIGDWLTAKSLGSAAAQTGKREVLSETFALTGHNVSHAELKRIYEWQMVRGVNLLCPHLEGYSNRGIRKRDYPTAMYYQQPWWEDAGIFFDTVSRIGMMLGEGEESADTLLIHTLSTAWCLYDGFVENRDRAREIRRVNDELLAKMRTLEDKHILYHLGDETLMERHGRVEGGKLIIGRMAYSRVIVPEHTVLFENTERLLAEFRAAGGEITTAEDIAPNPVCEVNRLSYTMRTLDGERIHYFVNSDDATVCANITVGSKIFDPTSCEYTPFSGSYTFAPFESLILIDDGTPRVTVSEKKLGKKLSLEGEWEVKGASENSLTLDRCDYYFDGELVAKGGFVLDILPRINELRRPVNLRQVYRFRIDEMPEGEIYLTTETPDMFEITVNGKPLEKHDAGDFRDISFRKLPMRSHLVEGENVIELTSTVSQRESTYKHIDKSWLFETMSNCLSYDMEIEPIYVVGNFGVKILGEITELDREAYRVKEHATEGGYSFSIVKAPRLVDISSLDFSGYPQFAGSITLTRKLDVADTALYVIPVVRGANSVHVAVNGTEVGVRMFPPYELSLDGALRTGENEITLTVINNLRNMQGPSHLREGECYYAARDTFYRESNVFRHKKGADEHCHDVLDQWDDDVCLVHFGLKG